MALSDCVKCWETPCTCGHEYKSWADESIKSLIKVLEKELESRKPVHPYKYDKLPIEEFEGIDRFEPGDIFAKNSSLPHFLISEDRKFVTAIMDHDKNISKDYLKSDNWLKIGATMSEIFKNG